MKLKRFLSVFLALVMVFALLPMTAMPARAMFYVPIDEAHFPNAGFLYFVTNTLDPNKDGMLTQTEIEQITAFSVEYGGIDTLQGIESFTALQRLYCNNNKLTSLDLSQNTALVQLDCSNNDLTSLDLSYNQALKKLDVSDNASLTKLNCYCTSLSSLDVSGCTALEFLSCGGTQLTSLDVSSCTALEFLSCGGNQLTSLDVSSCTALEYLECAENQLTSLDVSKCTALKFLSCGGNQLTALDLSKQPALENLYCKGNKLTNLDVSKCTALEKLNCGDNQLTSLDVENCTALNYLGCYDNQLTSLDVSKCTALVDLETEGNDLLTVLDISACPALVDVCLNQERVTKTYDYTYYEYYDDVTDYYLSVAPETAVITVANPAITAKPADQAVLPGVPAAFKVAVSGEGLSYQWQSSTDNGGTWSNISGATGASYSVTPKDTDNGTLYHCVVSNAAGSVTSDSAKLTVTPPKPSVATQPADQSVTAGQTATFTVAASSVELSYQWQSSADNGGTWNNISGATAASYTLTTKESDNGTLFRCIVKNTGGSVTSDSAKLTVTAAKPAITTQPAAQTADAGKTVTFTVAASGTGLSYQWQSSADNGSNWTNISGATAAGYTLTTKESDNGTLFRCIVKNAGGSVTSNSAKLTVTATAAAAPAISSVKADATSAKTGETITWTAKASGGSGTLKYYFILYKNGKKVKTRSYSTKNTFSYTPKGEGTFKVKVYVKDGEGTKVNKTGASVTVTSAAPTISSVKAGISSAYAGEKITWTATASGGSGTLKYYFVLYKDGKKIKTRSYSTAKTFSYTPEEAGSYKVKVYVKDSSGAKANKTSGKIAVTLGPPAILSVKAGKTSSAVGEKITWTAKAVGSEQPLKYYFVLYKDGTKIKTRSYSTTNTFSYTPTEAGTYKVKVYVKDATGEKVYKTSAAVTVS